MGWKNDLVWMTNWRPFYLCQLVDFGVLHLVLELTLDPPVCPQVVPFYSLVITVWPSCKHFPTLCAHLKKNMLNCEAHCFTLRYFWPLLNFTPLAYSMLKSYFPLRKSFRSAWWPLHLNFKSPQGLALFLSRKGKIMLIWRLTIF